MKAVVSLIKLQELIDQITRVAEALEKIAVKMEEQSNV